MNLETHDGEDGIGFSLRCDCGGLVWTDGGFESKEHALAFIEWMGLECPDCGRKVNTAGLREG